MEPTLISTCQMFLIPVTICFAALGVAKTEQLKTGISLLATATTAAWLGRVLLWSKPPLSDVDYWTVVFLSCLFLAVWSASFVTHAWFWRQEHMAKRQFRFQSRANLAASYRINLKVQYKLSAPLPD
jgi:hypothetical protein